jgi:D-tyrosyl-tRNA(Tyr) deacylase
LKLVVQRVSQASVVIEEKVTASIGAGMVVLVGFEKGDRVEDVEKLARKVVSLRIFEDAKGKMNLSLKDVKGSVLVVPNFTLAGDCRKGRRPSFQLSEEPERAKAMFEMFVKVCRACNVNVETGTFGANMKVHLTNDGPVTFIITSQDV